MIIRRLGSELGLFALIISQLVSSCNAFTFALSSQPSQCQSLTAQWSGGQGPYRLFLIPVGHVTPEIRTIVNMEIPAGQSTANLTLQLPQNSQFVAVMSDATGFGTGGTSTIYTVGSGPSDCLPSSPSKADFYMYFAETTPSQCGSFGITWDAGVKSAVHIYGVIPGGQSFDLGAPSSGTGFDWTTNVRQGTQMLFLAAGSNNENGGSTDILTVGGGSSACINAQSPSSTASPAAGGVSTIAQPAPGTAAATGTNPGQTSGAAGATVTGTGAQGATGTAGATGSAGATGTAGATTSPTGGSPTVTTEPTQSGGNGNPNSPSGVTTRGSGGGTVTGDPNLPLATSNHLGSSRSLNLAAIIGGTLGGLALILILLLIWLLCARRRRRRQTDDRERLISRERRTDLLAESVPVFHRNSGRMHDWFGTEPFVPPMSAEEFAERTGGSIHEDQDDEYQDYENGRSMSSLGHAALTNSSAAAAMYGALARSPSYSTSGHGHRASTQLSHSQSHSQNVSHSPAHSTSRHGNSSRSHHGHSRSFSNPFISFTPTSGISGRRDITPPTPMSTIDPFSAAVSRPVPPSSWNNQASGSSNAVPRVRQSTELSPQRKSDEEEVHQPIHEGDIVDIPPSYDSLKRTAPRVRNPE